MAGLYLTRPLDMIVIDTKFMRDVGILQPEPVLLLCLHELYHALHPRSSSDEDAGEWSKKMMNLLIERGYIQKRFKNLDGIALRRRRRSLPR